MPSERIWARARQCGGGMACARDAAARARPGRVLDERRPDQLPAGAGAKELAAEGFVLPGLVDVHTNPGAPVPGEPLDDEVLSRQAGRRRRPVLPAAAADEPGGGDCVRRCAAARRPRRRSPAPWRRRAPGGWTGPRPGLGRT